MFIVVLPETIPSNFALHKTCVILRTLASRSGALSAKTPFGQKSSLNTKNKTFLFSLRNMSLLYSFYITSDE